MKFYCLVTGHEAGEPNEKVAFPVIVNTKQCKDYEHAQNIAEAFTEDYCMYYLTYGFKFLADKIYVTKNKRKAAKMFNRLGKINELTSFEFPFNPNDECIFHSKTVNESDFKMQLK
jgi:hypothetical protein